MQQYQPGIRKSKRGSWENIVIPLEDVTKKIITFAINTNNDD
jgi:hypothetical protein